MLSPLYAWLVFGFLVIFVQLGRYFLGYEFRGQYAYEQIMCFGLAMFYVSQGLVSKKSKKEGK